MIRWVGVLLIVALAAPVAAEGPSVAVEASPTQIRVGDPVELRVTLSSDPDSDVGLPVVGATLGEFEVLAWDAGPARVEDGRRVVVAEATVTAWRLGEIEIPSIVAVGDTARTGGSQPITIHVVTVGIDEGGDVRPIKTPVPLPWNVRLILMMLLIALAALVAGILLFRRLRRRAAPIPLEVVDTRPAHVIAYEEIDRLEAEGLVSQGRPVDHLIRLTDILRRYLGSRYEVSAIDMTTAELLEAVRGYRESDDRDVRAALSDTANLLDDADLVKFADVRPDRELVESGCGRVRAIVETTREPDLTALAEAS